MHDKLRYILNSNVGAEVKVFAVKCYYDDPYDAIKYLDKVTTSATFAGESAAIVDAAWLLSQRCGDGYGSMIGDKLCEWTAEDKFIEERAPIARVTLSRQASEVYTTLWNFSRKPDTRCSSIDVEEITDLVISQKEYECISALLDWFSDRLCSPEYVRVAEVVERLLEGSCYE